MSAWSLAIPSKKIEIVDRKTGKIVQENVAGDSAMKLGYGTKGGVRFVSTFLVHRPISKIYGAWNDHSFSKKKIRQFARDFDIDLAESEKSIEEFISFNDFFTRKLKRHSRPVATGDKVVVSPADGRLLVFPKIDKGTVAFLKWAPIKLIDLFGHDTKLAKSFEDGQCVIVRLCPSDYHRFHFPVSGTPSPTRQIDGCLHSVSPYALEQKLPVHCLNLRTICEVQTNKIGKVAILEIGALFVGSIVQTYQPNIIVNKGDEKGFFKFGGSTTILFFEKGSINLDPDIVANSNRGLETLVKMGERIGCQS